MIFINSKNNINGGNSYDNNIKIDLNNVDSVKIEESAIVIKGKAVAFKYDEWQPVFVFFSKPYKNSEPMITFNSEPNLYERMIKAFQTLAKYNNAERPKEKF